MTTRNLNSRILSWALELGLADWAIEGTFVKETQSPDTCAEISWQPEWKEATICFRKEQHLLKTGRSMDHFIVHELLHLLLEGHKPITTEYDPSYEAALNTIASLLVNAYEKKLS